MHFICFRALYSSQFTLSTQLRKLHYPVLLSHRRITTVSLETFPLSSLDALVWYDTSWLIGARARFPNPCFAWRPWITRTAGHLLATESSRAKEILTCSHTWKMLGQPQVNRILVRTIDRSYVCTSVCSNQLPKWFKLSLMISNVLFFCLQNFENNIPLKDNKKKKGVNPAFDFKQYLKNLFQSSVSYFCKRGIFLR